MSIEFQAQQAKRALIDATATTLASAHVASRIAAKDAALFQERANLDAAGAAEVAKRLGWVSSPSDSIALLAPIESLRDELRAEGVDRVVLAGMGGSSLAPEVITKHAGVPLDVLDSTDPDQVRRIVSTDIERTVLVVSSKSGSTIETDSQRRIFEHAFEQAGIDASRRIVVVTDPGSPLEAAAHEAGYRVFLADPNVGGRYSALTAFGLVPSGLAGANIRALLSDAADAAAATAADTVDNPALQLAAALLDQPPVDKVAIYSEQPELVDFPDWIEQLIAESTGKLGTGRLPVVVRASDPEVTPGFADVAVIATAEPGHAWTPHTQLNAPLGAQFVIWEVATAALGYLLGINPFDQPDVESAKVAARSLLADRPEPASPAFTDRSIAVFSPIAGLLRGAGTIEEALDALLARLDPQHGFVAVQSYLDRSEHPALTDIRARLARAIARPVTFGWGPRFLHSTGQYHKGGPREGVFLQITRTGYEDVAVPGRPFTLAQLITAQAEGDAGVLASHGLPVVRFQIGDEPQVGIDQLLAAVASLNIAQGA